MPKHIVIAVDSLIKPYGLSIETLLKNSNVDTKKKWLTIEEAKHYSGLSRWALWDAAKKGSFKKSKLGNARKSKVLIDKQSFDFWIESHCS